MKSKQDMVLEEICSRIIGKVPTKSIILAGSRATGQAIENSDYDIAVVMRTALIPFYLKRLKGIEAELSQKFGVTMTINPLPLFRIYHAKGNLFFFKLKMEAITIYGKDYLKELAPGSVSDISIDWHFSYLFTAMSELVQNFDPALLLAEPDEEQSSRLTHDAAKAIIYCTQLYLLAKGCYETEAEALSSRLQELREEDRSPAADDIELALAIRAGDSSQIPNPLPFWFRARQHLLSALHKSMPNCSKDTEELASIFQATGKKAWLKNLQYFALTMILKKEVYWRCLITRQSIERKVQAALLWLMLSVTEGREINQAMLNRSCAILKGYAKLKQCEDSLDFWREMRNTINTYSTFACTVMGV
jgi:predicted nucleotidyltransferase